MSKIRYILSLRKLKLNRKTCPDAPFGNAGVIKVIEAANIVHFKKVQNILNTDIPFHIRCFAHQMGVCRKC